MALEDDFSDIAKKARHGQGLSLEQLAARSGVSSAVIEQLERGVRPPCPAEVEALSHGLGLRPAPLRAIAERRWEPRVQEPLPGVETIWGDIGGYAVKGYVLYDPRSRDALLVDTAYHAPRMLAAVQRLELRLIGVALTHGHVDHAGGLERILERWPVPVYVGRGDVPLLPWRPADGRLRALTEADDGAVLQVGELVVRCVMTPGHTPGGICYRTETAGQSLCFVGDTLFAGSIGRANPPALYRRHLASAGRLLTLPATTRLLPGHGPATTVSEEIRHNPFLALADGAESGGPRGRHE